MRKKLTLLAFALAATAAASLSVPRAEAACPVYCCPGTTLCSPCCSPRFCERNCP
ncbi:MAG TPA: hypothetical protein VGH73_16755 [Thermoanaerobaculia bacterium]|jgi:hypothetical protein